jgi:hypothetical protein
MEAIVLSFIGKTQEYLNECIYQIRLFTDKPIYYIYDDYENELVQHIYKKYDNIYLIKYELVKSEAFDDIINLKKKKFQIVYRIGDRKEIFIRAFERFYLLYNLCILKNIKNVLFLELDNLIYDDPDCWFSKLTENKLYYMMDNIDRCAAGIFISRNNYYLNDLLNSFSNYILNDNGFLNEMTALDIFYQNNKEKVYILPTHWDIKDYSENYKDTIFDSSAMGIYLFGYDLMHTNDVLKKGCKNTGCFIDYTNYNYIWKNIDNKKIPFINYDGKLIKINNLHIHAKNLIEAVSI